MFVLRFPRPVLGFTSLLILLLATGSAWAGGPKYVAGVTYFNPSVLGQPVHWTGGQVAYYVDQGPLNSTINNQQATAMVDAAAALWSAVPTAGVTLTDKGPLNEDVSGTNVVVTNGALTQPADVTAAATNYAVGVIFDADGSVTDALYGSGASDPTSCQNNGVQSWIDSFNPDATMAHGIILLNGRCATTADLVTMMSFQIERAFGRILGLDFSQVNPDALTDNESGSTLGWPVMQPLSGACGVTGGECIPDPTVLRSDDIAALNRIYPITSGNLSSFPGKEITASKTISIQGTVSFKEGLGMQGVNVVARPLDANGNPMYQYTVTAVSGALFNGNHGNPVTGWDDANGNLLSNWGSNQASLQGSFDLSGIPLPPGAAAADYQVSFEAINPLYILTESVGPYIDGQPAPSGTLNTMTLPGLSAGSAQTIAVNVADSAVGNSDDAIGSEETPRMLPPSGMWSGRISQVGQTDWFTFPVRGGHSFTIVTEAVDETGMPSDGKAMPAIGVWDAFDATGSSVVGYAPALNGMATGESWLQVTASGDDLVRMGIADQRGDGRPDYAYRGWVLSADTVEPLRLPAQGGPILIRGTGFRIADTVQVGGQQAIVTSIAPTEITAIAPPAAIGVTGPVDVEVDDLPAFNAATVIKSGISYNAGSGDALTLVTAPMNTVPLDVPIPFTVLALGPDLTPAGGVTVLFNVTSGTAVLGCGLPSCTVTATGDGRATMNVFAVDGKWSIVTATLTNGSSLQAQFAGGTTPTFTALSPQLSVAAGATVSWTVQTLVLQNGAPLSGQTVFWQSAGAGIAVASTSSLSNSFGNASQTLTVGPLAEGQTATVNACLNGVSPCVSFSAFGARPEYATVHAVSGTTQSLAMSDTPSQITLRVQDIDGNAMAGGIVNLYQTAYTWTPPCPDQGVCAQAELLATQVATGVSAVDGSVTFIPATLPGVATNVLGVASTGVGSSVNVSVEQRP